MLRIREEILCAAERYMSISWSPEAKESSVGANDVVIRDRREETVSGEMSGAGEIGDGF
jgi:hypothetical protein